MVLDMQKEVIMELLVFIAMLMTYKSKFISNIRITNSMYECIVQYIYMLYTISFLKALTVGNFSGEFFFLFLFLKHQ
jgi:uncharacterized YccA/Bax inhibitor family protein